MFPPADHKTPGSYGHFGNAASDLTTWLTTSCCALVPRPPPPPPPLFSLSLNTLSYSEHVAYLCNLIVCACNPTLIIHIRQKTTRKNIKYNNNFETASSSSLPHHLVGLVVRCPPREWKIPGSNPACAGIFSGSSHTSDLKIGTPVATLPGA